MQFGLYVGKRFGIVSETYSSVKFAAVSATFTPASKFITIQETNSKGFNQLW